MGQGEGGMIWENDIETCVMSYMKRIASPGSRHDTGCLGWCTEMTRRDGTRREVEGRFRMGARVHPWQIHVEVWQNQYNIVN